VLLSCGFVVVHPAKVETMTIETANAIMVLPEKQAGFVVSNRPDRRGKNVALCLYRVCHGLDGRAGHRVTESQTLSV
jgi:hypothetical protein